MNWLPEHRDFRSALKDIADGEHGSDLLDRLSALARHTLGYLETIQLDNTLRRLRPHFAKEASVVRIALIASMTVDHLAPALRVAGLRRGHLVDVHVGAYGQHRQEVIDETSALHRFAPSVAVFL